MEGESERAIEPYSTRHVVGREGTALIDMMVSAALSGGGGSACSYSILIFPFGLNMTCSCLSGDPVAEIT